VTSLRGVLALFGLVVLVAGCNVKARVEITVHDDGSGAVRSTVTLDADAVARLGGAEALDQNVPLGDLRTAGWTISKWKKAAAGAETITLSHPFTDQADLVRRMVDLVGRHGILRGPVISHERGWFSSRDVLAIVVDVRSLSPDIVHDAPLAQKLRAAGADPVALDAQLSADLKSALHLSVVLSLPGGQTETYDAAAGSVKTMRLAHGGTDWDRVVKFGIGLSLALLATLFFLAAGVGIRRNRRRASQRVDRGAEPDRAPLM
jgi:hypothetical protein